MELQTPGKITFLLCRGKTAGNTIGSVEEFYERLLAEQSLTDGSCTLSIQAAEPALEPQAEDCRALLAFMQIYQASRGRLKGKIEAFNRSLSEEAARFDGDQPYISRILHEFVRMNGAGKLLRGALVNIGYTLFAGEDAAYSDALAVAFELFQTAILIHDDIIDHAKLRRGQTTIHENYLADWAQRGIPATALSEETARSLALCAGDIGMYLANLKISEAYADSGKLGAISSYFHRVVLKTLYGEVIDVALPFSEINRVHGASDLRGSILEIYRLKTAWYTLIGPLCLGAMLAGAEGEQLDALSQFGEQLGIAFQIKDDILGIYGDAETGKDVGSDISEYKQTLLYAYVKEQGEYFGALSAYYGKQALTAEELHAVQDIFRAAGALQQAEQAMNECFDAARGALLRMDFLNAAQRAQLSGLLLFLRLRHS